MIGFYLFAFLANKIQEDVEDVEISKKPTTPFERERFEERRNKQQKKELKYTSAVFSARLCIAGAASKVWQ